MWYSTSRQTSCISKACGRRQLSLRMRPNDYRAGKPRKPSKRRSIARPRDWSFANKASKISISRKRSTTISWSISDHLHKIRREKNASRRQARCYKVWRGAVALTNPILIAINQGRFKCEKVQCNHKLACINDRLLSKSQTARKAILTRM